MRTPYNRAHLGGVLECLGTKELVADACRSKNGTTWYGNIGHCLAAMALGDVGVLGIRPWFMNVFVGAGSSEWFKDLVRAREFAEGIAEACESAYCAYAGGESPALGKVVYPETVALACDAIGMCSEAQVIRPTLRHGDRIVIIPSTGIHANGLSNARMIAEHVGYRAKLSDGREYGETLLVSTAIYNAFIQECQDEGVEFSGIDHVTGHGWTKALRTKSPDPYIQVFEHLPPPMPVFQFLQENGLKGPVSDIDAYKTWNMGAGLFMRTAERHVPKVIEVSRRHGREAIDAGWVERGEAARVIIKRTGKKDIEYKPSDLAIRA